MRLSGVKEMHFLVAAQPTAWQLIAKRRRKEFNTGNGTALLFYFFCLFSAVALRSTSGSNLALFMSFVGEEEAILVHWVS